MAQPKITLSLVLTKAKGDIGMKVTLIKTNSLLATVEIVTLVVMSKDDLNETLAMLARSNPYNHYRVVDTAPKGVKRYVR